MPSLHPLIGVNGSRVAHARGRRPEFTVHYADAVLRAGGIPVTIATAHAPQGSAHDRLLRAFVGAAALRAMPRGARVRA